MAEAGQELDTFPKFLLRNADQIRGDRPAMRHKDYGIWQSWSWADAGGNPAVSLGLQNSASSAATRSPIVGQNRPRSTGRCARAGAGGVPMPVYADSVAEEMVYVLHMPRCASPCAGSGAGRQGAVDQDDAAALEQSDL